MIKVIQKDKKNRSVIYKIETKKKIVKSIAENLNFLNLNRWNILVKLYNFSGSSSKSHLIFKCLLKGSKKGINKFYRYSRQTFLKLVRFGALSGLQKASW